MSERSHRHISAAHSRSRPTRTKRGRSLSNSSAISNCEPHDFIHLRTSAAVGPESWEADGCLSFLKKRDRREQGFFIETNSQCTRDFPSRTSCACSLPKQRRKDCVCVIGCQITRTRIHTLLKCLASARHDNRELYQNAECTLNRELLPECTLQTNQSVKTKKRMMCPPGVPYIAVLPIVTSWAVAGQQVVFLYCMLQARVTLTTFPIANPRGRSSKFP